MQIQPRTVALSILAGSKCGGTSASIRFMTKFSPICEIVARKIIEINAAGWHEPEEIAKLAAAQLG